MDIEPSPEAARHALIGRAQALGCILANERVERRLAAILAADVTGFSALMERDEERHVRTHWNAAAQSY